MIKTGYTVFFTNGDTIDGEVSMSDQPDIEEIHRIVDIVVKGDLEHVWVLSEDGARVSMFVDEVGHLKHLPRNDLATVEYRRNWLTQHPSVDPETLPWIAGDAILFHRRVWF